jgi:hypothetical protein
MQQKEVARLTMPECHRLYLDSYVCTSDDRKRRLKRASQLRPNNLSSKLLDAIFFVEPADPDEVVDRNGLTPEQYRRFKEDAYVNVRRRRGEMPWFEQMMRWGYPPGWIAQRGEFNRNPSARDSRVQIRSMRRNDASGSTR